MTKELNKIIVEELTKENFIKIDPQDIEILLDLLEGGEERKKIINYIRKYVYPIKPKVGQK